MTKKLLTLLLAVAASMGTMFASTKIGDLYYNLNAESKTAEVTFMFYNSLCNHDGKDHKYYNLISCDPDWVYWDIEVADIPSSITHNDMKYTVTSIGEHAFQYCSNLKSVTIPNTITSIGEDAFYNCSGLTSVTIGNSVTSIAGSAFSGCSGLTSVTIPNSVTSIAGSAFSGCSGLTSPVYNAHIFVRMPRSYSGAYTIPDGITSIFNSAFYGCSGLTSVTIPNSVTSIEYGAFYGCTGLTSITIPNSVTSIGNWAFADCSGLTSVTIPNSVTSIGNWAFAYCSGLTSVTIPNSVTSVGNDVFENCTRLTNIYANCDDLDRVKQLFNNDSRVKFAPSPYSVIVKANSGGNVAIPDYTSCDMTTQITATANPGYHFTQWNDGNTQNPRTISITGDATYTASFAKNTYTISVKSANTTMGTVSGSGTYEYLDQKQITATANYGYHFVQWSDSSYVCDNGWGDECWRGHWEYYTNPTRTITIKSDSSLTATFAKNTYTIQTFAIDGTISGGKTYSYLDPCSLTVTPNFGFKFTQWSDGNTDNPRTFIVERDSIFTAEIVQLDTIVGQIGDNLTFTLIGDSVTVTGFGNMYDYRQGQSLLYRFRDQVKTITLPEGLVYIGAYMFEGCNQVKEIILPPTVTAIGEGAFLNCTGIRSITCNASQMVTAQWNSFDGLSQYTKVYVPADLEEDYQFNTAWNKMTIESFGQMYQVSVLAANGTVSGTGQYFYNRSAKLTVTADYGYHFTQWADGNKNNPRSIVVTSDTTLVAEFAKNTYQVLTSATHGSVESVPTCLYMEQVSLTPIPEPGYVFAQWSDGNTDNPRIATITKDTLFTAEFMLRPCYIALTSSDQSKGSVSVDQTNYPYGSNVTITATPMLGYKLEQWSNGVQDNPYTLTIVSDTTLMAMFVADGGSCGDNINWVFDIVSGTLTFTGSGAMNDYTGITVTPWYKYQTSIKKVVFDSNITHIGAYSFYGCTGITAISIPNNVISIGKYAFAECKNLKSVVLGNALTDLGEAVFYNDYRIEDITCYPISTPNAESNCFFNIEKGYVYLYIQSDAERNYKRDPNWKDFDIKVIGATENAAVTDDVVVDPKADNAEFTWPKEDKASTYTIEITKDGEVFCRLTFASTGQLVGIAFAPGRDSRNAAQYATQVEGGFQFTVTGLNSASKYGFSLDAKDSNDQIIKHYQGEFATEGYQDKLPTALDEIDSSSLQGGDRGRLILVNGQIFILRGDKIYTLQGQEVK